jgi:hypothetical protein
MAERAITEADITSALNRRTDTRPGDNGRLLVFGYATDGRILKVVLTADQQVVVSVMVHRD